MSEPIDTMLAETTRKSDSYCLCKAIGILCDRVEQVADTIHDCFSLGVDVTPIEVEVPEKPIAPIAVDEKEGTIETAENIGHFEKKETLSVCELCGKQGWSNKTHECSLCGAGIAAVVQSKLLKPVKAEMALPTPMDEGFGDGYMKYSKKDTRTPVEKAQGLAEFKDVLSTVRDDKGAGIAETYLQCIECGTFQWSKKQAKCLHCGKTQAQLIQDKIREQAMKRAETAPKDPEMDKVKDAVLGTKKAEEAMNQQMDEDLKNAFF